VTESLLEVLARQRGLRIGLVTKSTLIERDIPLLQRIAERNTLVLHLTITTPNAALARLLEPRAPRPDLRLRTVARLRQAGLRTGILCSPLLPGITDTGKALDGMAKRAKDAGASFFCAQPLFLKPCSKEIYLAFIREHFPALEPMYRQRFQWRGLVRGANDCCSPKPRGSVGESLALTLLQPPESCYSTFRRDFIRTTT
jgi:DNA repair photolyase